jgi:lipid-A-disaccharide synthase
MNDAPIHIMLVAGEPSGDQLGVQLLKALRSLAGESTAVSGVGGPRMTREGFVSLFPMEDIAVIGLAGIVWRLPRLLMRIRDCADYAAETRPDAVVLIDAPEFNHRVARRLRRRAPDVPIVIYVAPQVWASRPRRAEAMRWYVDEVLALLPFEPPVFEKAGLSCTVVGHPVIERVPARGQGASFRARHGIAPDATLLALLPGSRLSEVRRLMPIFREAVARLVHRWPKLVAVVPTVDSVATRVRIEAEDVAARTIILTDEDEKFPAFEAADIALAASGTVSLELALAGTPTVVAYKVDPLTAAIARRVVTVPYLSLVNLIAGRAVIPELLQEACTGEALAAELDRLLTDGAARDSQRRAATEAIKKLGIDGEKPSLRAARAVLATIEKKRRARVA